MRSVVLVSVAFLIAFACSGSPTSQTVYGSNGPAPHLAVASIELRPNQASLLVSNTTRLVAIPKDASGNQLAGRTVQWSSSDSLIASVSDSGVVHALQAGRTGVIATSEGVSAAASVTVSALPAPPVASVSVSLAASSLTVGQSTQATAVEKDASGNTLTGRTATFASSNTAVATVSNAGYVTAISAGSAVITATSESVSGSAGVSVTTLPAPVASVTVNLNSNSITVGQTTQAVVTLKDGSGNTLTGRSIAYTSSNTAVASVSSSGSVTALAAGTAVITATSEGINGSATLTVTAASPPPVAAVTLTLNSSSLTVGQGTQAAVTLKDASGNTLSGRTVTYASTNTAVATVSSVGYVTAVAAGNALVSATSEGVSGSATLTVTAPAPPPVSSVTVTLNSSSITVGQSTQAVVTLKDANGNTLMGRTVTFASNNTAVASVSATGLVSGLASGTAQITATSESQTGSATLNVQPSTAPGEPVYNSATDKLILTDNFDSYTGILTGSPSFVSKYPDYRAVDRNDSIVSLDRYVSLAPGRGGSGNALRLAYGNPAVAGSSSTLDGASDIVVGPSGRLSRIGGWNGTLPEQAGPYVHFMFTTWIRFSPGANPAGGPGNGDSGVKGFMFWHDGNQRYENPPHRLKDYNGGRYPDTRWDASSGHPPNYTTGLNHYKTANGEAPVFSQYADGNWHRFTVELYPRDNQVTPHLYAGHQGERIWIDGVLVFDNVDNLGFNGDVTTVNGCPPWGADYCYTAGVTHWMVFGNYVNGLTANNSPAFYVDFDDWIAWTR